MTRAYFIAAVLLFPTATALAQETLPAVAVPVTAAPPAVAAPPAAVPVMPAVPGSPVAAVPAAPAPAGALPTAVIASPSSPQAQPDGIVSDGYKSLIFTSEEMRRLRTAMRAYRARASLGTDDYLSQLQNGPKQIVRMVEHPQFYLSSIVYHTPAEWVVWVNGQRFASETPSAGNLTVLSVDKRRVTFEWKPELYSLYTGRWMNAPKPASLAFNDDRQSVTFTLYTNQTFSAYNFTVSEGWLPPTRAEQITLDNPAVAAVEKVAKSAQSILQDESVTTLPTATLPAVPQVTRQ